MRRSICLSQCSQRQKSALLPGALVLVTTEGLRTCPPHPGLVGGLIAALGWIRMTGPRLSAVLRNERFVGLAVHELVELGLVEELQLEEPALVLRALIGQSRVGVEPRIDLDDLARDR